MRQKVQTCLYCTKRCKPRVTCGDHPLTHPRFSFTAKNGLYKPGVLIHNQSHEKKIHHQKEKAQAQDQHPVPGQSKVLSQKKVPGHQSQPGTTGQAGQEKKPCVPLLQKEVYPLRQGFRWQAPGDLWEACLFEAPPERAACCLYEAASPKKEAGCLSEGLCPPAGSDPSKEALR